MEYRDEGWERLVSSSCEQVHMYIMYTACREGDLMACNSTTAERTEHRGTVSVLYVAR